ncbi:hypothetical protein, partial [Vibrio metoecus]|uniref:hypothetical protein n=2 Tax=Vibrio TaxID=662 RepID=UPI001C3EAF6E
SLVVMRCQPLRRALSVFSQFFRYGALMRHSISKDELLEYAKSSLVFYGLDLSRVSTVLIAQILQMESNRTINVHSIGDELKRIESGRSKRVGTFKHLPLKGLSKAHFFDALFILANIKAEFGFENGGNKRLNKIITEAFQRNESGYLDEKMEMFLAHETTIGALDKRSLENRLTGEWIVFKEYQGVKYYLSVASHTEDDSDIFKRVQMAYEIDFPFLQISDT